MGGKGSGNRMVAKNQAWKKSPVIGDNGITATKEEISKISNALANLILVRSFRCKPRMSSLFLSDIKKTPPPKQRCPCKSACNFFR